MIRFCRTNQGRTSRCLHGPVVVSVAGGRPVSGTVEVVVGDGDASTCAHC